MENFKESEDRFDKTISHEEDKAEDGKSDSEHEKSTSPLLVKCAVFHSVEELAKANSSDNEEHLPLLDREGRVCGESEFTEVFHSGKTLNSDDDSERSILGETTVLQEWLSGVVLEQAAVREKIRPFGPKEPDSPAAVVNRTIEVRVPAVLGESEPVMVSAAAFAQERPFDSDEDSSVPGWKRQEQQRSPVRRATIEAPIKHDPRSPEDERPRRPKVLLAEPAVLNYGARFEKRRPFNSDEDSPPRRRKALGAGRAVLNSGARLEKIRPFNSDEDYPPWRRKGSLKENSPWNPKGSPEEKTPWHPEACSRSVALEYQGAIEEDRPFYFENDLPPLQQEIKDSMLKTTASPDSKTFSRQKMMGDCEDRSKLKLIHAAEEHILMSSISGDKVDGKTKKRCKDIATAIFHDKEQDLKEIIQKGSPLSKEEIQRRILEAVELDSLKCLDVLCEKYEENPISKDNVDDIHLFHRRYGLSFWPLTERPRVTALHFLANKLTSTKAMKVLDRRPKFLNDFSDVKDSHGSTPLLLAIKCYNVVVVGRLLQIEPIPNIQSRNKYGESPIRAAALNDHADILRDIMRTYSECKKSSELDEAMKYVDKDGHTILYPASQSGWPEVLELMMEQSCLEEFVDQERKAKEWVVFAGNVCAAGVYSMAKKILEKDPSLLEKRVNECQKKCEMICGSKCTKKCEKKCQGQCVTPLMRATEADQRKTVDLLVEIKCDLDLFTTCDHNGRNVFHYAVKNASVLQGLLDHFFTLTCVDDDDPINKMDDDKNTPIKLAALLGYEKSFEILSKHTKTKLDIFSENLIHAVDMKILERKLHEFKENDSSGEVACLLRGDHEEHQPFLESALKGNVQLMDFFLQQGADPSQRNSDDQTALHCAVLSGNLDAVEYLLVTQKKWFLKMIDFTDDVNITAAGYATQIGHAEILRCLLERNAQMKSDKKTGRLNILDSTYGFFKTGESSIKEIIQFCTRDKKIKMLQELFEDSYFGADCIMSKLVEETPDVAMMIFDLCVYQDKYFTHRSYGETMVGMRVSYSFFPFKKGKDHEGNMKANGKLEAIESMVKFKRDDCLGHPVVIRFLNEKINSSRIPKWFILNILLYLAFMLPLTAYGGMQSQGVHDLKSARMIALSAIILLISTFHFFKELFQIVLQKTDYITDYENYIEWVMYVCAVIYVVPWGSRKTELQIGAGAISLFLAWVNFSLFLKRFSLFGIYIIMAKRVFLTVCKVLPLVVLIIIAFSLSFSLLKPQDGGFKNIPISFLTTFVMMTGELDYRDTFLASGTLHALQKIILVLFILVISIAIMNLLTGLAVDDTNEIMKRSKEEKRIYKATLVITLEKNFHRIPFISSPVVKYFIEDDTDKEQQYSWLFRMWQKIYDDDELEARLRTIKSGKDDNNAKQLDELRTNNKLLESKLENGLKQIETTLRQIQAGGTLSYDRNYPYS